MTMALDPPPVSPADAAAATMAVYGRQGTARRLAGERTGCVFLIEGRHGPEHVLKLGVPAEQGAFDLQARLIEWIGAVDPSLPVQEVRRTRDGELTGEWSAEGWTHLTQLLSFLPGAGRTTGSGTAVYHRRTGNVAARLVRASRGFFHRSARRPLLWDIGRAQELRPLIDSLPDRSMRRAVEHALARFETDVLPQFPALRAQVIHGDVSPANLLCAPDDPERIVGVIDFGDAMYAPLVAEPAIAASFLVCRQDDPLQVIDEVRLGFEDVVPLEPLERSVLLDLVITRLVMRVVIHEWRASRSPRPPEDPGFSSADSLEVLERLQTRGTRRPPAVPAPAGLPSPSAVIERRAKALGPGLRQFYDQPFMPVRGHGAWVQDESGRRYLDAYNNVPHVGHSHPHVVAAVARQLREINSNTRYLHPAVVEYAERLLATMPPELDTCLFTCTGSDANDLALRLARAYSGREGIVATESAYHGNTVAVSALGPLSGGDRVPWVSLVPHPPHGPQPDPAAGGAEFAQAMQRGIDELGYRDVEPAAFIYDTVFVSDGFRIPEPEVMRAGLRPVREAGALVIADEVQVGQGRVGDTFWGFGLYGAVPDLVTMGKPTAAGIPVGSVVTRREIVDRFLAAGHHYFNTFAGSPVAAAAGLAVMDVLEREGLQRNARVVGGRLLAALEELRTRHGSVRAVRGRGFAIGVELRAPDGGPGTGEARAAINALLRHGVLVGLAGPARDVLKIRPPMVFGFAEMRYLLDALDQVLDEIEGCDTPAGA
ncbi:aminotransferase class III-fold pyridoxal phosphate-dependent enzyme [Actinomadura graeca]|uniref:Aminotransferase class III-fold pyridoxal phosphate-dependent enzyme n=1 Tax=Actinomadura graeca TaxID=2750812 RepID=A0ABX8QQM3_9ACTN|nr:aminotransferase class III-fold pyridoxal phosphate-dependent enzyme [Actinomadura graeca]QXJ21089.1 aminotransferase class III-fold pyridoxal phosphate-dependent enzyme [Actinomadura graeca]